MGDEQLLDRVRGQRPALAEIDDDPPPLERPTPPDPGGQSVIADPGQIEQERSVVREAGLRWRGEEHGCAAAQAWPTRSTLRWKCVPALPPATAASRVPTSTAARAIRPPVVRLPSSIGM